MTPEIVTYSQKSALQKARQRQYARDYYHRNRKSRQAYARKYYARKRKQSEPEPVKSKGWFLVVPHSDSLLSNIWMSLRVARKLIVTGPTESND